MIRMRHPERLVYPNHGTTKADVAAYYAAVAPVLLPHLRGFPVTLKRYPDDTTGPSFWEKDAPAFAPRWVPTFPVERRGGGAPIRYIVVEDERTLLWCVSVGTLEFHPFLARVPEVQRPAHVVFDLDPGDGADILSSAQVALLLRELLERLGLKAFPKVSGSRGVQVYVPMNTPVSYAATQSFARAVAEMLHAEHPKLVVAEMERAQRRGRVFIDWSQNADFKTTVAVYSLRAKRHRPWVSMPVSWEELGMAIERGDKRALYFLASEAPERIARTGDLFAPVITLEQHLPPPFSEIAAPSPARRNGRTTSAPSVRPAEQGGRRSFVLHERALALEWEGERCTWMLPDGIPNSESREVDASTNGDFRSGSPVLDAGTYELVEGSLKRGFLHLYFSGKLLRRDYVLARKEKGWRFRKGTGGRWPEPLNPSALA